jgi:predicted AAA+ superfamily ATPase
MKAWRDVIHPNADVLAGTLQAAEFAADLSAVHEGKATAGSQDARTFYARTYVTAGLSTLLKQVVRRLNGTGGDPVINLQTSFGGGKTHSLLAVYHLATRTGSARTLAGLSTLVA